MPQDPKTKKGKRKAKERELALFPAIRHPKKRAFLAVYAKMGRLMASCAMAKVTTQHHYYWLRHDPAYAEAFADAQYMAGHAMEEEAVRRAMGYEETHYTATGTAYPVMKYSDTLIIFMLKGAMPHKYGDRVAHTGGDGKDVIMRVIYEKTPIAAPAEPMPL